jgi:hypothetical protein
MKSMEFATAGQAFIRVLGDRARTLGLVLGEEPAMVTDADLRATLKAANRAKTSIEAAILACGKFDQKFDIADAKSPRKIVISKVEVALSGWSGDPEAMAAAIMGIVGTQFSEKPTAKTSEVPAPNGEPREPSLAKSGDPEFPKSPLGVSKTRSPTLEIPRSMKAARAVTPRRQKMVDSMIAESHKRAGDGNTEFRDLGGAGSRTLNVAPAEGAVPKRE